MTIRKRTFPIALDEYSEKALERLKKLQKYDALIKEKCKKANHETLRFTIGFFK